MHSEQDQYKLETESLDYIKLIFSICDNIQQCNKITFDMGCSTSQL